ncbi:unnamed protein product [Cunninghamella blakesleeana]
MKVLPLISLFLPLSICASQHIFQPGTENDIEDFKHTKDSRKHVHKLLKYHPLIDGHNDFPMFLSIDKKGKINDLDFQHINNSHTDFERIKEGQLGGQFFSVYTECEDPILNHQIAAMESVDVVKRMTELYPKKFKLVTNTKQFKKAFRHGRVGSFLGVEGGHIIGNSMAALRTFHSLGVRYMTLTHNCHTLWAESCCDPNPPPFEKGLGLTEFGKKIVGEMNRLGVIVDISHVAHATMNAVLDVTKAPVMFSHSSSNALCNIERNVPDSVLRRIVDEKIDAVVMVNFYNRFITCSGEATIDDVVKHIEHISSIAGRDKVGIGADFNGIEVTPTGLDDVSYYPDLFVKLYEKGWTDDELIGLAGENLLRVWKGVEEASHHLRHELPAEDRVDDY